MIPFSCEDKTIAGVWRRAEATAANPAPFSKIVLSKLLVLPNTKAREDYFKQQSNFVTREGSDEYTEFSTSIQGEAHGAFLCLLDCNISRHLLYHKYSEGLSTTNVGSETSGRCTIDETVSTSLVLDVYRDWLDSSLSNLVCTSLRRVESHSGKGICKRQDGIVLLELVQQKCCETICGME